MCKEEFNKLLNYFRTHLSTIVWLAVVASLVLLASLYAELFSIFGLLDSLIKYNTGIYDSLITISFTLAGFAMAFAGILLGSTNEIYKKYASEFFIHASVFVIAGILLFSNIITTKMSQNINSNNLNNGVINKIFLFFGTLGILGVVIFFMELAAMSSRLIKISYFRR